MSSPSNNSVKTDWGQTLLEKEKNKKPVKRPAGGGILAAQAGAAKGSSSSSSSGGGGYGGGGGGGGVAQGPTKAEARAIIMAGMKDYLGREATGKEVKDFFKHFSKFAVDPNGGTGSGVQDEFIQDWIDDRPGLRKEFAQNEMATRYSNILSQVISNARSL